MLKELRSCYHQFQNPPSRQSLFKPWQTLVQSISLSFLLPHPYVSFPSLSFSLSLCCSLSRLCLVWTDKGQLSTTHPNGTITPPSFLPPQPAFSNICCFLSQYRTNEWTDAYGERSQTDVEANLTWLRVPLRFQRWDVRSMSLCSVEAGALPLFLPRLMPTAVLWHARTQKHIKANSNQDQERINCFLQQQAFKNETMNHYELLHTSCDKASFSFFRCVCWFFLFAKNPPKNKTLTY